MIVARLLVVFLAPLMVAMAMMALLATPFFRLLCWVFQGPKSPFERYGPMFALEVAVGWWFAIYDFGGAE